MSVTTVAPLPGTVAYLQTTALTTDPFLSNWLSASAAALSLAAGGVEATSTKEESG